MGKLVCDIPKDKGKVVDDSAAFAALQAIVDAHVATHGMQGILGMVSPAGQAKPKWHIVPQGGDWHIAPLT